MPFYFWETSTILFQTFTTFPNVFNNYSNNDKVIPPTYFNQNLYKMLKIVAD